MSEKPEVEALVARMAERATGGCESAEACCCDPDGAVPLSEWCDACLIGAAAHELRGEPFMRRALSAAIAAEVLVQPAEVQP